MASPQPAIDTAAEIEHCPEVIRASNGKIVELRRGLELGELFLEKREEFCGPGTRGKFTRWFQAQGYTQQFVSMWMRRAAADWKPGPHKPYKKYGKLKAKNGAAFRSGPKQNPEGFMAAPNRGISLGSYDVNGASFNPTSLAVPNGLSEKEWLDVGRRLSTVQGSSVWWIGDWVSFGFESYGKRVAYDLAQKATGIGRGSLYVYRIVSNHFAPTRRVPELTFKHHQVCATNRLTIAQQDELLADAVALGLSPKQLREEVEKIVGKKKRHRIGVHIRLWHETFAKLKVLSQGKRIDWFCASIVEDFVLANEAAFNKLLAADVSNLHGLEITDEDLPDFKGEN